MLVSHSYAATENFKNIKTLLNYIDVLVISPKSKKDRCLDDHIKYLPTWTIGGQYILKPFPSQQIGHRIGVRRICNRIKIVIVKLYI